MISGKTTLFAVIGSPVEHSLSPAMQNAAFAAIGVLLGAVMPSPRAAQGAGVLLFIVMLMLSGTGPPREVMTSTMNTIADVMPLSHAVTAIQDPWMGYGWNFAQLGVLAAIAVVCGMLATLAFRRQ